VSASIPLVLTGMRQRSFMLEDLGEIAHVDPTAARWALDEMLGIVVGLLADPAADDFAAFDVHGPSGIFASIFAP
jgi:hypothetical protein